MSLEQDEIQSKFVDREIREAEALRVHENDHVRFQLSKNGLAEAAGIVAKAVGDGEFNNPLLHTSENKKDWLHKLLIKMALDQAMRDMEAFKKDMAEFFVRDAQINASLDEADELHDKAKSHIQIAKSLAQAANSGDRALMLHEAELLLGLDPSQFTDTSTADLADFIMDKSEVYNDRASDLLDEVREILDKNRPELEAQKATVDKWQEKSDAFAEKFGASLENPFLKELENAKALYDASLERVNEKAFSLDNSDLGRENIRKAYDEYERLHSAEFVTDLESRKSKLQCLSEPFNNASLGVTLSPFDVKENAPNPFGGDSPKALNPFG